MADHPNNPPPPHPGAPFPPSPCPPEPDLLLFAAGRSTSPALQTHIAACPACRAAVADSRAHEQFVADFAALASAAQSSPADPGSIGPSAPAPSSDSPVPPQQPPFQSGSPPSLPLSPASPPGYHLLRELRRGGQGIVYEAVHDLTQRRVAIKLLLHPGEPGTREIRRFEREAEIAAALRHPGIVTVHDSLPLAGGRHAIVMELIEGQPLDQWAAALDHRATHHNAPAVRRQAQLAKLSLLAEVCDAVQFAHQRGIMHRDLKPDNIMVEDGHAHAAPPEPAGLQPHTAGEKSHPDQPAGPHAAQPPRPKILDFGIARRDAPGATATRTIAGHFAGTLAYASPEQVAGDPDAIDARTDIYTLGVVLFELLTGVTPYPTDGGLGKAVANITTAAPHFPSPWPARLAPLDEDLRTILTKSLAKEPQRRYQSAAALAADLRHYLQGQPLDARRDSTWYVLRTLARRHRRPIAIGAAAVLFLLSAATVALYTATDAAFARARARTEQARAAQEAITAKVATRLMTELLPFDISDVRPPLDVGTRVLAGLRRNDYQMFSGLFTADPEFGTAGLLLYASLNRTKERSHMGEQAIRQALPALYLEYGPDHPQVARALQILAELLLVRGRFSEASRQALRALEIYQKSPATSPVTLAETQLLLARILLHLDRPDEAERWCNAAQDLVGDSQRDSLTFATLELARAELAHQRGADASSAEHAIGALAARLASLPDWHPDIAECLRLFSGLHAGAPPSEPMQMLSRTLQVPCGPALSARLEQVAAGLVQTPDTTTRLGDPPSHEDLLSIKKAILGQQHPAVARSLLLVGALALAEVRYQRARIAYMEAASILEANLNPNAILLAGCYESLRWTCSDLLRFSEAAQAGERSLAIWSAQPAGSCDPMHLASNARIVALTQGLAGNFTRAEELYRQAGEQLQQDGLGEHYLAGLCMAGRGWCMVHNGRGPEGEALMREGVSEVERRIDGPAAQDQIPILHYMFADALFVRGQYAEARSVLTSLVYGPNPAWYDNRWSILLLAAQRMAEIEDQDGNTAAAKALRDRIESFWPKPITDP